MDKKIKNQLYDIDCSWDKIYYQWLIEQYNKEQFDIKKVSDYLLIHNSLINKIFFSGYINFNNVDDLFNVVDKTIRLNYDIICENDKIIIYKPNSYFTRQRIGNKLGGVAPTLYGRESTIYCCLVKDNAPKNYLSFIIYEIYNKGTKYYHSDNIIITQSYLEELGITKFCIADNINERIKNETLNNIKLLEQEEINDDLYLYNYDYSVLKVNCKKINGNVTLIHGFTTIPKFLKDIVITGHFDCSGNLLETLINCPQIVHSINCSVNNLISLKGAPIYLRGDFNCGHNQLKNLYHSPRIVDGTFNFVNNLINTLNGAPVHVDSFYGSRNQISSIKGMPQIAGNIDLSHNKITNLDGLPNIIKGFLFLYGNKISTLKNAPKMILKGNMGFDYNYLVDDYRPFYDSNGNLLNER